MGRRTLSIAPILLDTCAAIWTTEDAPLSESAKDAIAECESLGLPVFVSPITAWEVGLLVSRGRVALATDPKSWFRGLLEVGVQLTDLTPDIFLDSSFLPSSNLRDPADRILAATARAKGLRLMTRDRPLLAYGAAGWLKTISC
ncbi:MAG: type II toxin-antitoxin system VapC family toxin [Caulobacteraceae bacterium]